MGFDRDVGIAARTAGASSRLACALASALAALSWLSAGALAASSYRGFAERTVVSISGYSGSAMEPFISPDGNYLLFNTSNVAPSVPALEYATRVGPDDFEYQGPILGEGVNEANVLSGTPSIDREGNLYFVSPRSYPQTLATVYTGVFSAGTVTGVQLVPGISGATPGSVDFDASVSPDGGTLYVTVGSFDGGQAPTTAAIAIYERRGAGFILSPNSRKLMRAVDRPGDLDYAASISANGRELFFTRVSAGGSTPDIYRAARSSTAKPFKHVQRVQAITGFAEAPSLSSDGTTLYFHHLNADGFAIETVTRP